MSSVSAHRRAHFRSILNLCSAACVLFLLAGRTFPRGGSLVHEPMGPRWIFTVGAVLLVDFWIALLTYRHVPFGGETWWRFALDGDGPRSVRAAVGASVVLLLWALAHLLSGVAPIRRSCFPTAGRPLGGTAATASASTAHTGTC